MLLLERESCYCRHHDGDDDHHIMMVGVGVALMRRCFVATNNNDNKIETKFVQNNNKKHPLRSNKLEMR